MRPRVGHRGPWSKPLSPRAVLHGQSYQFVCTAPQCGHVLRSVPQIHGEIG
jgi:hypothetical protein